MTKKNLLKTCNCVQQNVKVHEFLSREMDILSNRILDKQLF